MTADLIGFYVLPLVKLKVIILAKLLPNDFQIDSKTYFDINCIAKVKYVSVSKINLHNSKPQGYGRD